MKPYDFEQDSRIRIHSMSKLVGWGLSGHGHMDVSMESCVSFFDALNGVPYKLIWD